jgi:hypothetical protein
MKGRAIMQLIMPLSGVIQEFSKEVAKLTRPYSPITEALYMELCEGPLTTIWLPMERWLPLGTRMAVTP